MAYFQTDDIPTTKESKPKPLLKLTSPEGLVIFENVKSWPIRIYYKCKYAPIGSNGKRVWRQKLTDLGYKITPIQI